MKCVSISALIPACVLTLCPEQVISQSPAAPAVITNPASTEKGNSAINWGFDDLMSTLIQPRHIKLFYAGANKNWELAAAESRNLRSAFVHIAQIIPRYLSIDVEEATKHLMEPPMRALDAAIAAADSKQFMTEYNNLTVACNACHAYMEHPYIAIKVPDPAAKSLFPDQEFRPL